MDQFRGYAILGMIFVNYVGHFDRMPWMLHHHHEGMSYSDTIAPIFIFVVGMGFRLSFMRRVQRDGLSSARRAAFKRYGFLTILGFAIYQGYLWDALTDIGLSGLLALLLIDKSPVLRLLAAAVYLTAFQLCFTFTPYGSWLMGHSLNGGPLGPLSWCFVLLLGSVAYDVMVSRNARKIVLSCLAWGVGLCVAGWTLRAEWAGVKAHWPFSQYWMTAPYPLYSTGLCFLTLLAFYVVCDLGNFRVPHLTVLGENPLVLYLVQAALTGLNSAVVPASASFGVILPGLLAVYAICYGVARFLHAKQILVKI